ncbi:MAG: hypothetical protein VKQ33_11720 [Candidatus Sericytochromatia bacterium]|nr:hypothetical protein [Candidatus Sericytochromatia bacterium]
MFQRRPGLVALVLALTACQDPGQEVRGAMPMRPNVVVSPGASPGPARADAGGLGDPARAPQAARVKVVGTLRVPRLDLAPGVRLIGERGVGLAANNVVGLGTTKVATARAPYTLAQLTSGLVEGARVHLADAAGNRIPGIDPVRTGATGDFEVPAVPPGMTFVVVAEVDTQRGKPAVFRTLVKVGPLGATTVVDAVSTLVTVNVLEGLPRGELGDYNPARFQQAAEAASRNLSDADLPDFTDLLAVKARMDELVREVAALRDLLGEVKAELAVIRESLDELKEAALRSPPPGPSQGPSPSPPGEGDASPKVPVAEATTTPRPDPFRDAPECPAVVNTVQVRGDVTVLVFRLVEPGRRFEDSPSLGGLAGEGGTIRGPLPAGCPVWVQYRDRTGIPLGPPFQMGFPREPVRNPIVLPAPRCASALNTVQVPGTAVASLQFRWVEPGKPAEASPVVGGARLNNGTFRGPLPAECPVWVVYLDQRGLPLGTPRQATFPSVPVEAPINLPPPVGPNGPIL